MLDLQMDEQRFPELIRELYRIVAELEQMFPGRHFTPDGHMVGSIGECLAAYYYPLDLHRASFPEHDGVCAGRNIQIKATQRSSIELKGEVEHLLVIRLDRSGGFEVVYNGPGAPVWEELKKKRAQRNGYRHISLSRLRSIMSSVPDAQRLVSARPLPCA